MDSFFLKKTYQTVSSINAKVYKAFYEPLLYAGLQGSRKEELLFIHVHCSGRYGGWHSKDKVNVSNQKNVPRLIVFVMGGACFSEFRAGYEVTNERKNWEVIVGRFLLFFYFFPYSS